MLLSRTCKSCYGASLRRQSVFLQNCRFYSSHSGNDNEAHLNTAREWYQKSSKSKIPVNIAKTTFSRSSGPGGQKVNKYVLLLYLVSILFPANIPQRTSSKATTVWSLQALLSHVPKVLHQDLRSSRYYVSSSDSIIIQCDTSRSQSENEGETHKRLAEEIDRIYRKRVPGITPPEQKKKIQEL